MYLFQGKIVKVLPSTFWLKINDIFCCSSLLHRWLLASFVIAYPQFWQQVKQETVVWLLTSFKKYFPAQIPIVLFRRPGSLNNEDDEGGKKVNSGVFKILRSYSTLFNLSNFDESFWSWILKDCVLCLRSLQKVKLSSSTSWSCSDGEEV